MKKISSPMFLLFCVLSLVSMAQVETSQAEKKIIKFGTIAPANTPWSETLEGLKRQIDTDSKGTMQAKVYLGGQLGGELEILQGIRRGRIDGGGLTSGALASVIPELDLLELPYLFESNEEVDFILDEVMFDHYKKVMDEKGFILMLWSENGWRSIGTKTKAIKVPADLKNVKIRSQESKAHLAFWRKMGANPVAIAVPEVLPALQTGVVDGFDNTPLFTLAAEWNSAIKHFSTTEHIYQPGAVVYSKVLFQKLSPAEQKIVLADVKTLSIKSRAGVRALGDQMITVLTDSGLAVQKLTPAERLVFKKASDGVHLDVVRQLGGKSKEFYQLILDGKAKFAARKNKK